MTIRRRYPRGPHLPVAVAQARLVSAPTLHNRRVMRQAVRAERAAVRALFAGQQTSTVVAA